MLRRSILVTCAAAWTAAATAWAQQPGGGATPTGTAWLGEYGESFKLAVVLIAVLVIAAVIIWRVTRHRGFEPTDGIYTEPEAASSRFEQLLAEIQGLSLRVRSGEGKGYYRKIARLTRIFLERTGLTGVMNMSEADLLEMLRGGKLPQEQARVLISILEHCEQGSEHESEKLDFTAAELLIDLKGLVNQAEQASVVKVP